MAGVSILGFPGAWNQVDSQNVGFGLTGQMPPDVALEEQALNRKQQLANILFQRALQPMQGEMVGNLYSPPTWSQGLAQLASAGLGAYLTHKNEQGRKELADRSNGMLSTALQNFQQQTAPTTMQTEGPGAPQPTGLQPGEGYTPEELKQPTALYGTKQEALNALYDARTPAFFQEGPKPTTEIPKTPEERQAALVQLMASQHPQARAIGQLLMQQEQHKAQQELVAKQQMMLEQMKEQAAMARHTTPSGDAQTRADVDLLQHTTPSGSAQLNARDQLVTMGPNGELIPNQPVIDAKTKIAEAGAARNTTNINSYAPLNTELQKKGADKLMENYERLRDVPAQIENLQKARALISKSEPFVGSFGEKKLSIAQFFNNNLGTSINPEQIANANELRTRVFQNVMDNLKKMDAQPSQYQQKIMMDALGDIEKDPKALDRMLNAYEDILRSKVDIHNNTISEMKKADKTITFPYEIGIKVPERQQQRTVTRQGTFNGRKVVQYSDGTTEYAD